MEDVGIMTNEQKLRGWCFDRGWNMGFWIGFLLGGLIGAIALYEVIEFFVGF